MLAPHWKKIGFGLAAVSIVAIVALEYFFNFSSYTKNPGKSAFIIIIIGLFIPMIAREKQEDEMMKYVRRNALIRAFVTGILFYIFNSIVNMLFNLNYPTDAAVIIFWQLSMYHVYLYYLKKDIEKDKPELF